MNNLPKAVSVSWQLHDRESNPRPSSLKSAVVRVCSLPDSQNLNFYLPASQANANTTGRREQMTRWDQDKLPSIRPLIPNNKRGLTAMLTINRNERIENCRRIAGRPSSTA